MHFRVHLFEQFEGTLFPVPNDYESHLRFYYADYMQLPPLEKQISPTGDAEPFIPCNHQEILFWNDESREAWLKVWNRDLAS